VGGKRVGTTDDPGCWLGGRCEELDERVAKILDRVVAAVNSATASLTTRA
jgi:hypothetical protein